MIRPWLKQWKWFVLGGLSSLSALAWTAGALPATLATGTPRVAMPLNECHEKSGASANVLPSAVDAMACSGGAIIALASPHARPQREPCTGEVEVGASSGTLPDAAKAPGSLARSS